MTKEIQVINKMVDNKSNAFIEDFKQNAKLLRSISETTQLNNKQINTVLEKATNTPNNLTRSENEKNQRDKKSSNQDLNSVDRERTSPPYPPVAVTQNSDTDLPPKS